MKKNKNKINEEIDCGEYLLIDISTDKYTNKLMKVDKETWKRYKEEINNRVSYNKLGYAQYYYDKTMWKYHTYVLNHPEITDHINRDRLDNRITNLRSTTRSENKYNSKKHANASSKYKGVSYYKPTSKWRADIKVDGSYIYLGYYNSEISAYQAVIESAKEYNLEQYYMIGDA
jgi:hypothetical protein